MTDTGELIKDVLLEEIRFRLLEEGIPRIKKCMAQLTETEIWHRPNEHVVSVGNLVLHLCGNVRQWLISGMGGAPDNRNRDSEFEEKGPIPNEVLEKELDLLEQQILETLKVIDVENLLKIRKIQGIFEGNGISILVHVTEHFSYHVGQITYYTKAKKDMDIGYYDGLDLTGTS